MKVRRLLCNVETTVLVNVILLIHNADSMSECPVNDGYIRRGSICCKTAKCKENEDYILCTTELGQDQCVPCPKGTLNLDAIDTKEVNYHIDVCRKPDCVCGPEEAKLINPAECLITGRKMCECDRDRGFCGHDYMICQLSQKPEQALGEGFELTQDCTFEPCKPGFFKEKKGFGKCEKHQECPRGFITTFNGSSIKNRECEPEHEVVSDFTVTVKPNISDPRSTSKDDSHSWSLSLILILIVMIAVIIFMVCASIYCFCIRNRLSSGDQSICVNFAQKLRLIFSSRATRTEDLERNVEGEEMSSFLDRNPQGPANTTSCVTRVSGQEDESQQKQATVPTCTVQNVFETNQYSNEVSTASFASSRFPDEVGEKMNFSSVLSSNSSQTTSSDIKVNSEVHSEKPCAVVHPQQKESGVFTSDPDLALSEGNLGLDSLLDSSHVSSEDSDEDDQQTHSKDTYQSM
ncbi:uncharacterized protein LOC134233902 [Saccostrea cucullata]|uniref:uncharacterized protein LOC134233902 n=1 Tax=Saccostrea cuccullata TaxID=36930 RepID=UPI002ED64F40